jgi:N-methylhydantoinase A
VIIGADVGGTFTDIVLVDGGQISIEKIPTSAVQSEAVVEGVDRLARGRPVAALIHGTTAATNALLERAGARVALITDAGFEDVIEIGRQDRPSLYDPFHDRPEPLVDRELRFGLRPDDIEDVDIEGVDIAGAEAIAVAFIDADIDPGREESVARQISVAFPGVPISISSVVSPEFREFERISTTVLNAYLVPITRNYMMALDEKMVSSGRAHSMAVMRSSGGLMSARDAADLPTAVVLSGPAGGVVAARDYAVSLQIDQAVSFDMGGTSTDVCRISAGEVEVSYERSIDGYVCRLPSVGIHTVGAGGGSVAWIDAGGSLRVGPRSAGSIPGPACYGRGGTEPTVTDANVVLGRIDPDAVLGGTLPIDAEASFAAISEMARTLGMDVKETALGIVAITEDVMAGAIRTVSIDQGSDLTAASLIAFGGAGGLHAVSLARSLGMTSVVIPPFGGVLSAVGLLLAPPRVDLVAPTLMVDGDLSLARSIAGHLGGDASAALRRAGHETVRTSVVLDVRYLGQSHEIGTPWDTDEAFEVVVSRFNEIHASRNGFSRPHDPIEVVAVRCTAFGEPALTLDDIGGWQTTSTASRSERDVTTSIGTVTSTVVDRASLDVGDTVVGPGVITETESTTYLDVGVVAAVRANGSLELTW